MARLAEGGGPCVADRSFCGAFAGFGGLALWRFGCGRLYLYVRVEYVVGDAVGQCEQDVAGPHRDFHLVRVLRALIEERRRAHLIRAVEVVRRLTAAE